MTLLVTGGAGFIGSHFVTDWLSLSEEPVVTLDALTYAGHRANLAAVEHDARHRFVHGDILDAPLIDRLLADHRPRAIVHFAAESHVDRSIHGPAAFVRTNVEGTMVLLEAARRHWQALPSEERGTFRFHHVSTDEVYGSLGPFDPPFTEQSPYAPNSPYAASKAAADHLVRAWHATWGLPVTVSHSGDNYGPRHFPEKLIPLMVVRALSGESLPVYGDGLQERNWLHVSDHVAGIRAVLDHGLPGRRYNLGGEGGRSNLDVVRAVCAVLDRLRPDPSGPYSRLIAHVADRPGHDRRYAIDSTRARHELSWTPRIPFDQGLSDTVSWYLEHGEWLAGVQGGRYREWVARHYGGAA